MGDTLAQGTKRCPFLHWSTWKEEGLERTPRNKCQCRRYMDVYFHYGGGLNWHTFNGLYISHVQSRVPVWRFWLLKAAWILTIYTAIGVSPRWRHGLEWSIRGETDSEDPIFPCVVVRGVTLVSRQPNARDQRGTLNRPGGWHRGTSEDEGQSQM